MSSLLKYDPLMPWLGLVVYTARIRGFPPLIAPYCLIAFAIKYYFTKLSRQDK